MNIYEDEQLEQKLEQLSDLLGEIVLDLMLVGLRKVLAEQEIFREFVETKLSVVRKDNPF